MPRALANELMDDPALEPVRLGHALDGLSRLNRFSGAFPRIYRELCARLPRPARVLDLACARGDFVLWAAARAAKDRDGLTFDGCDFNEKSIRFATDRALARGAPSRFFVRDVLGDDLPRGYDAIIASLFFHHLTDDQAQALLLAMSRAAPLILVNDLERSAFNTAAITIGSRILTRSPIVHTDARLSAKAAFTRGEMMEIARRAGLHGSTIKFGGISRMMLLWSKSG